MAEAGKASANPMTKRNWIYLNLLVLVALGSLADVVLLPYGRPATTLNTFVQAIGVASSLSL